MAYNYITFLQLRGQLANRLNDPSSVFWPDTELKFYIQDAIAFWNCLTGDNRTSYPLAVNPAQTWYDMQTIVGSPRLSKLTDQDCLQRLTAMLLESNSGGSARGVLSTMQFTTTVGQVAGAAYNLVQSLQRKRDEFMFRTGCTSTVETLSATPNVAEVALPQTVIQARRAYWLPQDATLSTAFPLPKNDDYGTTCYSPFSAITPGPPQVFSAGVEPPLNVTITPPPLTAGQIELLTIESQQLLPPNPNASKSPVLIPVIMFMPNDFTPGLVWGALADLLMISIEGQDVERAQFARQRYEEYIALMSNYPFVNTARIGGVPAIVDAVETLDTYSPSWRTAGTSPPIVGISGQNLIAFPTATLQSVLLNLTASANIPVLDGDFIQLGDEIIDVILDEAVSAAMWKCGGAEAAAAFNLHGNIIKLAAKRRDKIRAMAIFADVLSSRPQRENEFAPMETVNETTD